MKRNLLKFALCAMALLPMCTWAEDVTWTFNNWSSDTKTNLGTDAALVSGAKWIAQTGGSAGIYNYYAISSSAAVDNVTFTANDIAISEMTTSLGTLSFYFPKSSENGRIRIDTRDAKNALYFKSGSEKLNVPALTAGKKVSIRFRTADGSKSIKMNSGNSNVVAYKQAAESSAERTDVFIVSSSVVSATTIAFNASGTSGVSGVNIYSISVSDATEEELLYANCKVKFGTDDYVTATSLWTFDQYAAEDVIATYDAVTNYAGLYAKGHNSGNASKVAEKASGAQTVGSYSVSTVNALNTPGGATLSSFPTSASAIPVDCIGINVGVPGTLYIVGTSNQSGDGYTCNIFFNSTSSPTTQALKKGTISVFSKTNTEIGTYVIRTSSGGWHACAVMFIPDNGKAVAMTKAVTLTAAGDGYATFSAPQSYIVPEGVTAYYVSSVDGTENKAMLTAITAGNAIPACTGVILYKSGVTENTEVTLTSSESYSAVTNQMQPNLAAYALAANNGTNYNYTLAAGPEFKHSDGTGTLAAGKAFLRTTVNVEGGGARGISLVFDEKITEVENVTVAEPAAQKEGKFFENGKLVIVKNGKKFNANGVRIY